MLVEAGCDIEAKSKDGKTAAMYAASAGQGDCLAVLIAAGCDLESRSLEGKTALDHAQESENKECAAMLLAESERRALAAVVAALKGKKANMRV